MASRPRQDVIFERRCMTLSLAFWAFCAWKLFN